MEKILIIEDDRYIRENVKEVLEMHGYSTYCAENGFEGLRIALDIRPHLIICDVMMPHMNGYQLLKILIEDKSLNQTPFIFMSAKVERSDIREAMQLGADDYITKPFHNQELINVVKIRLNKQKKLNDGIATKVHEIYKGLSVNTTHEFYTPLNSILSLSEILAKNTPNIKTSEIGKMAASINNAGERLHKTLRKILLYIDLLSTKNTNSIISTDVFYFSNQYIEQEAKTVAIRHDRLEDIHFELEDVIVKIDNENFLRIIEELTDNAMKFSPKDTKVFVKSKLIGNKLYISIIDHGRGMTQEEIQHIGPFVQFKRDKFEQQGLGLGLFISKSIIESCNGKLVVECDGIGTKATVIIDVENK